MTPDQQQALAAIQALNDLVTKWGESPSPPASHPTGYERYLMGRHRSARELREVLVKYNLALPSPAAPQPGVTP